MRFCFIDRVTAFDAGRHAHGYKNISVDEPALDDHFPEYPLFPGTQIIEAMAQLGGMLIELSIPSAQRKNKRAVLVKIEKAKFQQAVVPGDQLCFIATLDSEFGDAREIGAVATVAGQTVAQATLAFVLKSVDIAAVHARQEKLYRMWFKEVDWNLLAE